MNSIQRRKLSHFGHVLRKGDCLEKEIMQGALPGARKQGRPRTQWIDNMDLTNRRRQGTERDGIDLSMKRPTFGSRMVKDETRRVLL